MYVAMGALSAQVRAAAVKALPACYTPAFDHCLQDRNRKAPECARYEPVHKAYDQDFVATDKLVEDLPYCPVSVPQAALGAVALLALGIYIGKRKG